jgi:hypothetical protein
MSKGSIYKGMVISKVIIFNAAKYYSRDWRPRHLTDELIKDTGFHHREITQKIVDLVADEMGITIIRNKKREKVNDQA